MYTYKYIGVHIYAASFEWYVNIRLKLKIHIFFFLQNSSFIYLFVQRKEWFRWELTNHFSKTIINCFWLIAFLGNFHSSRFSTYTYTDFNILLAKKYFIEKVPRVLQCPKRVLFMTYKGIVMIRLSRITFKYNF